MVKNYKKKLPSKSKADTKQNKAIYQLRKEVSIIKKSEPKYLNTTATHSGLVNSTPKGSALNVLAQGDTVSTREGNRVRWKWITIRNILKSNSALTAPTYVRVMLVRRMVVRGQAFTVSGFSELFNDATPDYLDNYNHTTIDFKSNFKVMYDKSFLLGPARIDYTSVTGHNTAMPNEYLFTIRRKFNFVTDYHLGNAGTVADIDMNGLFLLVFTDNGTASAVDHYAEYMLAGSEL